MRTDTYQWVNPNILRRVRERLKLTPDEVEEESRRLQKHYYAPVTAQQLRKWEGGQREPDMEHLETLSEIYLCPVGWFFLDEPPQETLQFSFRGLAEEKVERLSSDTQKALRRFYELAQWTVDLIESLNIAWEVKVQPGEYDADRTPADHIVRNKKEYFGWRKERRCRFNGDREEAFRWWRKAIEGEGIFCFEMKLAPSEVRGASLWINRHPFILVNHQDVEAASGRIFTLLHEYAHLITSREGVVCDFRGLPRGENPEPFANRFAAEMLLSAHELEQRLMEIGQERPREDWSDRLLDEIRGPFLVSRDVVAIMLQKMQLAPSNFYYRKRQQWEAKRPWGRGGRRPTKKESKLREIGHSLANVLVGCSEDEDFPWLDASYVLDMKVEKITEFLQWARAANP